MSSNHNTVSDNIASAISSLNLSLETKPNWQAFLSTIERQNQASGVSIMCYHHQFDYEISISKGACSKRHKNLTISGCFEGWHYDIQIFFSSNQKLGQVKDQDDYAQCIHIPMRLAIKNISYHLKHGLFQTCIDGVGLGVLHVDPHAHVIEGNTVANKLIHANHLKIRHGKVSITDKPDWISEQISNYEKNEHSETKSRVHMSLTEKNTLLQFLMLPNDEQCSSYLLITCSNKRNVLPEAIKHLIPINQSQSVVAAAFMQGASADEIAHQTEYSTHTIYSYIKTLYKKQNISRQAQLTALLLPKLPHYNDSANEYLYESFNQN